MTTTTRTTNSGGTQRRKRRFAGAATAIALVATGAIGAQSYADDEGDPGPPPPPGEQPIGVLPDLQAEDGDLVLGSDQLIIAGGNQFDSTIVSKRIAANAFQVLQGEGPAADTVRRDDSSCLTPGAASAGTATELFAPVELPIGSRIKQVTFYGHDNNAAEDITVRLYRQVTATSVGAPISIRSNEVVDSFTTTGMQAEASVFAGADDLEEGVGSFVAGGGFETRFHTLKAELVNAAGTDHVLCGVQVDYQIPVSSESGTVFHPIDSVRAFDSRQAALPESGRLGPNETKVIDISDGYDSDGVAIPAQNDVVPATATAVAYNITIAGADGPNFVAVTAGDAASFTASAINYSAGSNVANGSTVSVAADQTIKLWGGDNTGSSHVVIDIVGYYTPPAPSNMAN